MLSRLLLVLLIVLLVSPGLAFAEESQKPKDRYQVPKGDVAALVDFIEDLQNYQPRTTAEILAYRKKAMGALKTAADRILKREQDKSSQAYRLAGAIKFQLRFSDVAFASKKDQRAFYNELSKYVAEAKQASQLDVALANTFCQILEESGGIKLAEEAYAAFGKRFSQLDEEELAAYGERMVGISRRLGLPGSKLDLEGTTVDGERFNWKSYRGKVVLVDFWATWCGPCLQELPNVKENYAKYHDQGFEVVGVSLDENRNRLRTFLEEQQIPWVTLFEEGAGWDHPMVKYYGINRTPTTFLVDRGGKVVATDVFGGDLTRELEKLLTPTSEENAGGE